MTAAVEPHISTFVPVETRSEANVREHWAERARRAKRQRDAAMVILRCVLAKDAAGAEIKKPAGKLVVRLVRAGARRLDSDNLARALKAVRDGVADALGRDDGDPAIKWEYDQVANCGREHGVQVTISLEGKE
jgi:hypothetical protein